MDIKEAANARSLGDLVYRPTDPTVRRREPVSLGRAYEMSSRLPHKRCQFMGTGTDGDMFCSIRSSRPFFVQGVYGKLTKDDRPLEQGDVIIGSRIFEAAGYVLEGGVYVKP